MHILELIFTDVLPGKDPSINPVLTVESATGDIELKEYLFFTSASQRQIDLPAGTYTAQVKSVDVYSVEFNVPDVNETIITIQMPASIVYRPDIQALN